MPEVRPGSLAGGPLARLRVSDSILGWEPQNSAKVGRRAPSARCLYTAQRARAQRPEARQEVGATDYTAKSQV